MRRGIDLTRRVGLAVGIAATLVLAVARAEDQPRRDDACTSQCDDQSDKCMAAAGRDKDKQKTCDSEYEDCLKKCN